MRETLLHFLWRTRRFDARDLLTTDGQSVEILYPGEHNSHAGPDFFNARIRLNDTLWAGNIEMHLKSSEWMAHRHDSDPAYDNVILHVVLQEDQPIRRPTGEIIPCLALRNRIPPNLLSVYYRLELEQSWIPCQPFLDQVPTVIRVNWLDRLLVERLERKTEAVQTALLATQNHWEEALYRCLAHNFGLKVNAEPFEMLARSLPLLTISKHKNNLFQIEALLFGQAGLFKRSYSEDYPNALAKEYRHLARKYRLDPLEESQWKFLRLRPANFPTIRLAQFAALLHHSEHLFSQVLETKSVQEIQDLFNVAPGPYWDTHFQFDRVSTSHPKPPGRAFILSLIINTIVPFLFQYGKAKYLPMYQEKALLILETLPPESNAVLTSWIAAGLKPWNAAQSQALLQLKGCYCDAKRCLECAIGGAVLR
jgi:hypothetical protein